MKPSTKVDLALSAMVALAKRKPSTPIALSMLAEQNSISLSYLEQVLAALRRNGLVVSVRGPGGGYLLARLPHAISLADVVLAIDCEEADSSENHVNDDGGSDVKEFWRYISKRVMSVYRGISLQDILDGTYSTVDLFNKESPPQAAE